MDYLHSVIIPPSAPLTVDQSDTGGVGVSDDADDNTCLVLKKQKVVSMKCDPIQLVGDKWQWYFIICKSTTPEKLWDQFSSL